MAGLIDDDDSKLLKQRGFQALNDQMNFYIKINETKQKIAKLLLERFSYILMLEEFFNHKLKISTKFNCSEQILCNY